MGWEDRPYYRDRPPSANNPLQWLMYGSVPLFTVFGIRVRAHASLVVIAVLTLLFGIGSGSGVAGRVQFVTALFGVILLHEFGHCFAARWTGGQADEILMTPLGGLAMAMARRRPWPTFVTVAGGPAVNVLICLVLGVGIYLASGVALIGPWQFGALYDRIPPSLVGPLGWMFFVYAISYGLLLFNLLPIFPLDGGQMLQAALWRPMGYYRSMLLTMGVGLVGSTLMVMVGIASWGVAYGGLLLILIGANCFWACFTTRKMMVAEGPWGFSDEDSPDYAAEYGGKVSGLFGVPDEDRDDRPKGIAGIKQRIGERRAEKQRESDARDYQSVDDILAKISRTGIGSLTRSEHKTLERTTARSRLKR